jgi:hypothetical protein
MINGMSLLPNLDELDDWKDDVSDESLLAYLERIGAQGAVFEAAVALLGNLLERGEGRLDLVSKVGGRYWGGDWLLTGFSAGATVSIGEMQDVEHLHQAFWKALTREEPASLFLSVRQCTLQELIISVLSRDLPVHAGDFAGALGYEDEGKMLQGLVEELADWRDWRFDDVPIPQVVSQVDGPSRDDLLVALLWCQENEFEVFEDWPFEECMYFDSVTSASPFPSVAANEALRGLDAMTDEALFREPDFWSDLLITLQVLDPSTPQERLMRIALSPSGRFHDLLMRVEGLPEVVRVALALKK